MSDLSDYCVQSCQGKQRSASLLANARLMTRDQPMHNPILEIRYATVWRGETRALKDFSVVLREGESVAILGPNGAGKSTLLKVLTGELRPEWGSGAVCRLFGEDLWSLEELRYKIGVVMPEEVARFHPEEVAEDAVLSSLRGAYGKTRFMKFSKAEKERAAEAMELMGIAPLAKREFGALSSGERRRFLIARSLVHQPEVLVLDEPSTALDFAAAMQLTATLCKLLEAGKTLLLVTHHPGEIPPGINRVVLLKDGDVFADGEKKAVLTSGKLSDLYQVGLRVKWTAGWCDVKPG
jgi:iron complex transport system ATP-binding protein